MNNLFNEKLLIEKAKNIDLSKNNLLERRKTLNKWISMLDNKILEKSNEISLQGEFIGDIFSIVLNAVNKNSGEKEWNIQRESSTKIDGQKADGVLGFFDVENKEDIKAVIELKSPNTNLETRQKRNGDNRTPIEQAFGYAPKYGKNCLWVIVSNYKEIRLYKSNDMTEYQVFFLDNLREDLEFKKFIYLMSFVALIGNETHKAKTLELSEEYNSSQEKIKKEFYKEYKEIRLNIFNDIRLNNVNIDDEISLEKSQKLLDRFLFICFAEDKNLLPVNSYDRLVDKGERIDDVFESFKMFCRHIDKGSKKYEITPYNGGLFKEDEILDDLIISNNIFIELKKLAKYDFESELNENILGHIFEQSISDLEELKIEVLEKKSNLKNGKRKTDGIYYTPKYICKYIVENSIKNWLDDKRKELGEEDLPILTAKDYDNIDITKNSKKYTSNYKKHIKFWENYREALRNITILDPACGSGAFLLTAFEFLQSHAEYVNQKLVDLTGIHELFYNLNKDILINNIFGVDLNKESIEITKLSLWLKTASKGKSLTSLDGNIKCGNSLIDDSNINSKKYFNWENEFPEVFKKGGFDIIIGNPPYGSKISKIEETYIKNKHEEIIVRMTDMFMFFINHSMNILNSKGYLSFIVPDVFLYQMDNEKLRKKIIEKFSLKTVINVGNVFENVERPCCIFIMNNQIEENNIINVGTFKKNNSIPLENLYLESLPQILCESLPKTIIPTKNIERYIILKKLEKLKKLEYFINDNGINRGISPDLKEAFILTKKEIKDNNIEKFIIKKTITGGVDLKKYIIKNSDKNILYITKEIDSNLIPNSIEYIKMFLSKITCNEVKMGKHPFYTLHRARNEEIFLSDKKICGVITSDKIIVAVDENQIYPTDGIYLFSLKNSYLTEFFTILMNSKFFTKLYQMYSMEEGRNLSQIKPLLLKDIPICDFLDEDINFFSALYTEQKELSDKILNKIDTFHKRIKSNFSDFIINKKIDKFYNLDFSDMLKEFKKQKIKLILKEQDEWEEYFDYYKNECNNLIDIMNIADKKIDKKIYELYNLTDEDIKFLEN